MYLSRGTIVEKLAKNIKYKWEQRRKWYKEIWKYYSAMVEYVRVL